MKLAHDTARPEGAPKRPFRKLKTAAQILASSIFIGLVGLCGVSIYRYDKECRQDEKEKADGIACKKAQDSLVRAKGWSSARMYGRDGVSYGVGYENDCIGECITHRRWKLRDAEGREERLSVLRDAIDEFEWRGQTPGHAVDSAARSLDSIRMVRTVKEADSANLVEWIGYLANDTCLKAGKLNLRVSAALNVFTPMLPEIRERGADSLLVRSLLARELNIRTLGSVLADMQTLKSALRRACEPRYVRQITGDDTNFLESGALFSLRNESELYERFISHALDVFWKAKLPDGRSHNEDSLAAVAILDSVREMRWAAYVNNQNVVNVYAKRYFGRRSAPAFDIDRAHEEMAGQAEREEAAGRNHSQSEQERKAKAW